MPTPGQVFHLRHEHAGQTLATALRGFLPGESWSAIRKLIQSRRVMVSGNLCVDAGRKLRSSDVLKVLPHPQTAAPTLHDVSIRFQDRHVVVVEKPAGVTSTRHHEEQKWPSRRKQIQPTLDEMLPHVLAKGKEPPQHDRHGSPPRKGKQQKGKQQSEKQRDPRAPRHLRLPPVFAVHRLDRDTSGLMVFARTPEARDHLIHQFRKHSTHRRYLAIVPGRLEARTISSRLVRDRGDGRRGSTSLPGVGKAAVTRVKPLEFLDGYTLVECQLETGRTHQIRIHLAEAGHPLCGERVYNQPLGGKPKADHSGAPRIALHAAEIGFIHPITQATIAYSSPLPDDLQQFLAQLRT
jgi:23S rRNA pseudouridine1911/1915/1917 synthase